MHGRGEARPPCPPRCAGRALHARHRSLAPPRFAGRALHARHRTLAPPRFAERALHARHRTLAPPRFAQRARHARHRTLAPPRFAQRARHARHRTLAAPRFAERALHSHVSSRRVSSRILAATSAARTRASPISTAWAPAATTRRTSAPVKNPLSLTTMGPGGISGKSSSVVSTRVWNEARSRLLIPRTRLPAARA